MVPLMERLLSTTLESLRNTLAYANTQGNLDGLLAQHFLGSDSRLGFDWAVECDHVWLEKTYDPASLPSVAALAFTALQQRAPATSAKLGSGLERALSRDPIATSESVTLRSPPVLIGLALAARLFKESSPEFFAWYRDVINALKARPTARTEALLGYAASYVGVQCGSETTLESKGAFELAVHVLMCSLPGAETTLPERRQAILKALVEQVLREDLSQRGAYEAALIWRAIQGAISDAASNLLRTPKTVLHVLAQFEASMKRWRWDSLDLAAPVRWPVVGEREVQDILYLMLRPTFPDLEDEDALPKFGHSTYKADFGIPSLGLLVEVKYAHSAGEFKSIEKQVLEDIVPYLQTPERYNRIIVFIYDDSSSVQVHDTTIQALRRAPGIEGVVIVSRPSHLPQNKRGKSNKRS